MRCTEFRSKVRAPGSEDERKICATLQGRIKLGRNEEEGVTDEENKEEKVIKKY